LDLATAAGGEGFSGRRVGDGDALSANSASPEFTCSGNRPPPEPCCAALDFLFRLGSVLLMCGNLWTSQCFPLPVSFWCGSGGPLARPPLHVQLGVAVPRNLADLQRRLLIALHSTEEASLGTGLLRGLFFSEEKGVILLLYLDGVWFRTAASGTSLGFGHSTGKRAARPLMYCTAHCSTLVGVGSRSNGGRSQAGIEG
jgi:hypothetical protein